MTDSRFPERWLTDRRFAQISDASFKLFVLANALSVSNRTDGRITQDDLLLLPRHVAINQYLTDELVEAGFWIAVGDDWQITGFATVQTTAAQLEAAEHARMLDRERKARSRARNGVSPDPEPVRADVTPDVPVEGTGKASARPGHDRRSTRGADSSSESELENSAAAAEQDHWHRGWCEHQDYADTCRRCKTKHGVNSGGVNAAA